MAREEQVALRKWGLGKDVEITAEEIKAMFNDVITAGGYNMMAYVVEYNGESIVKIKGDANADYMPVSSEIYKEKGETGVDGRVDSLTYSEANGGARQAGSFFGRLFK